MDRVLTDMSWLTPSRHSSGLIILGSKGSGKSLLTETQIIWRLFLNSTPQIYVDPAGRGAYFLDRLLRLLSRVSKDQQRQLLDRVWYIDMSGEAGQIVPMPMLYKLAETETSYQVAARVPEILVDLNENLYGASIEGASALMEIGSSLASVAQAMNWQMVEALRFLELLEEEGKKYRDANEKLLKEAIARDAYVKPAAEYLTWFMQAHGAVKARKSGSLKTELRFLRDPVSRAIYAGTPDGMNVDQIRQQKATVIVDLSNVTSEQQRRLAMATILYRVLAWAQRQSRGTAQLHLCIDELPVILTPAVEKKIETLLQAYGRSRGILTTLLLQELAAQCSEEFAQSLMSSGSLVIGNQSNIESRLMLARNLIPYREIIKQTTPVYASVDGRPQQIDERHQFYSPKELEVLLAARFQLPGFNFLVRPVLREGSVSQQLFLLQHQPDGVWPDSGEISQFRELLIRRHPFSRPLDEVLQQIAGQGPQGVDSTGKMAPHEPAKGTTSQSKRGTPTGTVRIPE